MGALLMGTNITAPKKYIADTSKPTSKTTPKITPTPTPRVIIQERVIVQSQPIVVREVAPTAGQSATTQNAQATQEIQESTRRGIVERVNAIINAQAVARGLTK